MSRVPQPRPVRVPTGMRHLLTGFTALCGAFLLSQCSSTKGGNGNGTATNVVVSVKEQKLAVYDDKGFIEKKFPISTSKYGLSDKVGKYGTPTGMLEVVAKIGHGAPAGEVFKNRRPTGEVLAPDTPGRDPIVSRIMWLRGLEAQNKNAYGRCIYIHGTAEERNIGKPVSFGCIRMKSHDVIELFNELPIGSRVLITENKLPKEVAPLPAASMPIPASQRPPLMLNPEASGPKEPELPVVYAQNDAPAPIRTVTAASSSYQQSRVINSDGSTYVSGYGGSPGVVIHSSRRNTASN